MKLIDYLKTQTLLIDGAMGTYYQQLSGQKDEISELANISDKEKILRIHKEYLSAGATMIRTNTFAINSSVLSEYSQKERDELLRAGCHIAKQAIEEEKRNSGRECFIAGDIGPIVKIEEGQNVLLEYCHICDIFLEEGIDIFWLETFQGTEYVQELLSYIRKKASDSFLAVSFCINKNGFTALGQKAERLLFSEQIKEADAIGFNCGIGSVHLKNILEQYHLPEDKYILAVPNAGYAEDFSNRSVFLNSAGYFGKNIAQIQLLGVDIVGGCCGTTPFFIQEIKKQLSFEKIEQKRLRISSQNYEQIVIKKKQESKEQYGETKESNLFKEKF